MSAPTKCQTCGRRPSERKGYEAIVENDGYVRTPPRYAVTGRCQDPIHDLADLAPEMQAEAERLREAGTVLSDANTKKDLRISSLEAQRDELADALETLLDLDDSTNEKNDELLKRPALSKSSDAPWCAAILNARAALASARKGK